MEFAHKCVQSVQAIIDHKASYVRNAHMELIEAQLLATILNFSAHLQSLVFHKPPSCFPGSP